MLKKELQLHFDEAYAIATEEFAVLSDKFLLPARDKAYALEYIYCNLILLYVLHALSLSQDEIKLYEHIYKLGGSLDDYVSQIGCKRSIENQKISQEKNPINLKISWKGFLPSITWTTYLEFKKDVSSNFAEKLVHDLARALALKRCISEIESQYHDLTKTNILISESSAIQKFQNISSIRKALENNDVDMLMNIMYTIYASISYNMRLNEGGYQSIFYSAINFTELPCKAEYDTNNGRIDLLVNTEKYVYIFELKLTSAEEAINQIYQKRYFERFMLENKEIYGIGIAFNTKFRNIKEWRVVKIK